MKKNRWNWLNDFYKEKPAPPMWQTVIAWIVLLIFLGRLAWYLLYGV